MMRRIILFFSLLALCSSVELNAQSIKNDLSLLTEQQFGAPSSSYYKGEGNSTSIITTRHKGLLAAYNPLSLTLKGTMYVYQHVISPQLSRHCPYEITCSNFSKLSIHEFGIVKGVFLSADRILRCNRIGLLDVHPLDINERTGSIYDPPLKYR